MARHLQPRGLLFKWNRARCLPDGRLKAPGHGRPVALPHHHCLTPALPHTPCGTAAHREAPAAPSRSQYKQGWPLLGWRPCALWPSGHHHSHTTSHATLRVYNRPCRLSCPPHLTHEEAGATPGSQGWKGAGQAPVSGSHIRTHNSTGRTGGMSGPR